MPNVVFYPDNREIEVKRGENLLRAAMLADVHINASCGGEGSCGKCRVVIDEGQVHRLDTTRLSEDEVAEGYALACRTEVMSNIVVRIPPESQFGTMKQMAQDRTTASYGTLLSNEDARSMVGEILLDTPLKKFYLQMPEPSLEDNLSDLERIRRALSKDFGVKDVATQHELLKALPGTLRTAGFKVTATVLEFEGENHLVRVEGGDTTGTLLGAVVDIGTTTIYVQILDLVSGEVVGEASEYSGQISCGEDVISRIVYSQKPGHLEQLQMLAVKTLNKLLGEVYKECDLTAEDIDFMIVGANTTMTHLFLGIDPKYIREAPYIPVIAFAPLVHSVDLGIDINKSAHVHMVPCRASWMGGDIVAGVLGTGMFKTEALTLFVDLGTNGEIVLGNNEWLIACSCSAGPAFEGGTIKHGMRATRGAIEQVRVNPENYEPMILTIGQARAKGICGSGLIDAVASLFLTKVIDQRGKYNMELVSPRLRTGDSGNEYVLVFDDESAIDGDIVLTEADIENLIRTKGAIYAGITSLLDAMSIPLEAVEQLYVAGGFGRFLQVDKAITLGLFPEFAADKVKFVGNSVLLGTRLMLLSNKMNEEVTEIAQKMTYLELSTYPSYYDKYVSALFLPHTEMGAFPSVMKALGLNT